MRLLARRRVPVHEPHLGVRCSTGIDLHVHVSPLSFSELYGERPEESSAPIRLRVLVAARAAQQARFAGLPIDCNASMGSKQIRAFCPLPAESETMLRRAMERMHLSARAYDRIVKVARTIADLAGEARIAPADIAEAIRYRSLDRESAKYKRSFPIRREERTRDASRRARGSDNAIQRRTRLDKQSHTQRQRKRNIRRIRKDTHASRPVSRCVRGKKPKLRPIARSRPPSGALMSDSDRRDVKTGPPSHPDSGAYRVRRQGTMIVKTHTRQTASSERRGIKAGRSDRASPTKTHPCY